MLETK